MVFLGTITIHLIVHTVTPGNWLGAIIISIITLWAFLPASSSSDSQVKTDALTFKELAQSVNLEDMDSEEQELHSNLGTVFNAMAQNAARDLYSSDITSTDNQSKKPTDDSRITAGKSLGLPSVKTAREKISYQSTEIVDKQKNDLDSYPTGPESPFNVKLEVDPKGKLHYIFQDSIVTSVEDYYGYENSQDDFQEETIDSVYENSGIGLDRQLENIKSLYQSKFQQEMIRENQDLLMILTDHLDRLKVVVNSIVDSSELMIVNEVLEPFLKLLLDWLLEDRGLLFSTRPNNNMKRIARKVMVFDREELQINQLSNYIGKLATLVRFLTASGSFNWLTELFDVVSGVKTAFPAYNTECLQAIRLEVTSLLGESIRIILSSNPDSTSNTGISRSSSDMEV